MKKITSFLCLMLMLLVANVAKAEVWVIDTDADPLIGDASWITSPYTEASEGSIEGLIDGDVSTFWHSDWHTAPTADGIHYFQVDMTEADLPDYFAFTFTRRNNSGNQIVKWSVWGVPEGADADCAKTECVFIDSVSTPFNSQTETLYSQALQTNGCKVFRFYEELTSQPANHFFHLAEFQILPCKQISDIEDATNALRDVFVEYSRYSGTFETGTHPGQYGVAEVAAFEAALTAASDLMDGDDAENATLEQINAAKQAIIDTYQAVLDSKVPMDILASGYYFIHAAMAYTQTTTTEDTEDPDTGDIIQGETITTRVDKAIRDNNGGAQWATLSDETKDATFLWQMTYNEATGHYDLVNVAYDRRFGTATQSNQVMLNGVADSTSEVEFVPFGMVEGVDSAGYNAYSIHHPQENNTYQYFHQGNHNNGAGVSGNVVGWAVDPAASHWYLTQVSAEEAQALIDAYAPIKDHDAMMAAVDSMLSHGKEALQIAIDDKSSIRTDQPLFTDAAQFTSPYTCSSEGSIEALLDDDKTTFWHSEWSGGAVDPGTHYFVVNIEDGLSGGIAIQVDRRQTGDAAAGNDHPTKFVVYGATEYDATADDGSAEGFTELGTITVPFDGLNTATSNVCAFDGTYNYFKFACTEVHPANNNRGYFHMSKLQVYPGEIIHNATSQYVALGELATNLETVIAAAPDSITAEYYEQLRDAYTPFWAAYVNPTALRTAIGNAEALVASETIGTDPGYYTAEVTDPAIDAAKSYDAAGVYTQENSDNHVAAVNAAMETIAAAANQPQADKWYKIQFDSQENYEANNWATGNINDANLGDLYGTVAAPANILADDNTLMEYPADGVYAGQAIRFMNEADLDADQMAFRFIAVGDTAYVIQHKSGLYINTNKNLGLNPAIFNVKAVGLGKNIIKARGLDGSDFNNGGTPSYIHAQRAGHLLVFWAATDVASNSALYIHEIEDATADAETAKFKTNPNGLRFLCYPLSIQPSEGKLYELQGKKSTETTQTLCFNEVEKTTPGRAALYVKGDYTANNIEDENSEDVELTVDITNMAAQADSLNGCHGTYAYHYMDNPTHQAVVVSDSTFSTCFGNAISVVQDAAFDADGNVITDKAGNDARDIMAGSAWIELDEVPEVTGTYALEITIAGDLTAIENVKANLEKVGKIYTIDGKFLGNGNLQTIQTMGRGLYIVNGMKIAVK